MKSQNSSYKLFPAIILFLLSAGLLAQQNQGNKGFVPEVGQQGKDVVWVPTPQELVDTMLSIAHVTPEDFVIDLGSGDGRTVITAAKRGARAVGVEFNPNMVALSRKNAELAGVSARAQFIEGDLYEQDLSKATVITMFLLPEINLKLRPRLLNLKPGTRIVSNTFTMGEWEADYEVNTDENWSSWNTALLWYVPAKVEGTWKIGKGELDLTQEFQFIHGTLKMNGKESSISDGRLRGDEITFRVGGDLYVGRVDGTKMLGTVTNESRKSDWSATLSGS
ncbi:MAG: class I SAM-dependent methyltransferase [Bacteroidales bacterium]|nr:class I SAM-dependent methyltransferase [Bacteroidales bacterium]